MSAPDPTPVLTPARRTRIKVCGVRDAATAEAAVRAGADAVGLVFVAASPRAVDVDAARRVVAALPAFVEPVGLFVDEDPGRIMEVATALSLRTVQLHGRETPGHVAELAPLRVIKALAFGEAGEAAATLGMWTHSRPANLAAVLFDAPPPPDAATTGGTGRTFDWRGLARLEAEGALADLPPVILAGGLTPANVAEAIGIVKPYAVDVSSGVESSKGVKDTGKIEAFCRAVRSMDHNGAVAAR